MICILCNSNPCVCIQAREELRDTVRKYNCVYVTCACGYLDRITLDNAYDIGFWLWNKGWIYRGRWICSHCKKHKQLRFVGSDGEFLLEISE